MRKQNWPVILNDKIEEYKNAPFEWGKVDCLRFAGLISIDILENDPYGTMSEDFAYTTEEEAKGLLDTHFGGKMANVFGKVFEEVPPKMAGRGDIAVVDVNGVEICGVIDGTGRRVACKAVDGLLFISVKHIVKAWRVD